MTFPHHAPVSALARPLRPIRPEDSLTLAFGMLRENGGWVPVVDEASVFLGWIGEKQAYAALRDGMPGSTSAQTLMVPSAGIVHPTASPSEALRTLSGHSLPVLAVVDDEGRFLGALLPSDLLGKKPIPPRPAMVGGMATPFGVYLTTGTVTAGPGGWALAATGFLMVVLLLSASVVTDQVAEFLIRRSVPIDLALSASSLLSIVLFFGLMRLIPLSGTHGAEHQVVHAIERNEALEPEIVERMPRVHPRCGTNFGVGFLLFLSIGTTPLIASEELRLLLAAILTLTLWRPLGSFVQLQLTTKKATPQQLAGGIRSGKELLEKFQHSDARRVGFGMRLVRSGLFHVMVGGWVAAGLAYFLGQAIGYPIVR